MKPLDLTFEDRHPVRIVGTPDRPEWVARDVCRLLGITNTRDALQTLAPRERGSVLLDTPGGEQRLVTVTEPGLYRLIFRWRKPIAERLKTWVCYEVLPTVRKYGCYPPPKTPAKQSLAAVSQMVGVLQNHEERLDGVEAELGRIFHPDGQRWSVRGYCNKFDFDLSLRQASLLGKKCSRHCREHDIDIDRIDDPRFGEVNLYPEHVLDRFVEEA